MASPLSAETVRARSRERGEPAWLSDARCEAYERHLKLEPPRWRRTELGALDVEALARAAWSRAPPAPVPGKAPKGATLMPLAQAAREHESVVRPLMDLPPGADKWEALVAALWTTGSLLLVERGVELSEPVALSTTHPAESVLSRDALVLDRGAKASVVSRVRGSAKGAFVGARSDVETRDGSQLSLATLQDLQRGAILLDHRRALVRRDSRLAWVDGQFGGGTSVTVNESRLVGPGGQLRFIGAFFGSTGQHLDVTTSALHEAPHTHSRLDMKGALNDDGYSANYSIVNIGPEARNSSGHQHQETLLLSRRARADAIPKLDVENNDVSASHGATVGQVDPEQLFYLRSRGFSELAGKRLIVEGFFEPLLREIPVEDIQDEIRGAILSRLKE